MVLFCEDDTKSKVPSEITPPLPKTYSELLEENYSCIFLKELKTPLEILPRLKINQTNKYKHNEFQTNYYVVPIGIETLGSIGPHALDFIKDIGHRITESTGEKKSTS